MYGIHNKSPADEEVIDVLIAISHVSARLARKLTVLAAQRQAIEELRNAAAAINDIANWLTEAFSSDPETEAAPAPAPAAKEPEPVLAFEDVRAILADKSREGFTAQIRELLQKYGASKLSEVDAKHYKALIADVEGLSNG